MTVPLFGMTVILGALTLPPKPLATRTQQTPAVPEVATRGVERHWVWAAAARRP